MWGGNPCVFIKDLNIAETWSNYTYSYVNHHLADVHKNEFTTWNSAYLQRESTQEDVIPDEQDMRNSYMTKNYYKGLAKYYI